MTTSLIAHEAVAIFIAFLGIGGTIAVAFINQKLNSNSSNLTTNSAKLDEIHILVNSNLAELLAEVASLNAQLAMEKSSDR